MILGSLHNRIVVFFTLLLLVVQLVAFYFINSTSYIIIKNQNLQALKTGELIFQQLLSQNRQRLIENSTLMSADFGFRKAVATNDSATVLSVLNNHGARIKADMMMLVSLDNRVIASTLQAISTATQSPLAELISSAENSTGSSKLLLVDGKAYQIALVPVLAPDPIAWVVFGFLIDNKLAQQFREVTGLHVTFISKSKQSWSILASTQTPELGQTILTTAQNGTVFEQSITIENYSSLFKILQQDNDLIFATVLQRSEQESMLAMNQLRVTLVYLALLSLSLSLLGSFFIARKIIHPLKLLTDVVSKIRKGDFEFVTQMDYQSPATTMNSSVREVDILRQAYVEILRLAHEDVLTGLPNRVLFNERLKQMVINSKRTKATFFVLMLDLNRFKFINDVMGHHAGDEVLKIIGNRLKGLIRESDTVSRLGGDEFAILLTNVQLANVRYLADKLVQCIEVPMTIEGNLIDVSCSIGIAVFPIHGQDEATILRHADAAMYMSKSAKSGSVVYDPGKATPQNTQLNLLSELRNAVYENQLELHYQPQIKLSDSTSVTAEALVRWQHPTRGMVPPNEFIDFAESSGLIKMVTHWVIKTAIHQSSEWLAQGLPIKVSINISSSDLLDPAFPQFVEQILLENQLPASMFCLEITEGTLMKDKKLHGYELTTG